MSTELARELVMIHGWNSTSCQILNPGINHWFSPSTDAVVGYTRRGSCMNAAGSPVCAPEHLATVCDEFESFARRKRCRVCYVCAEDRLNSVLTRSRRHAAIVMGAQPVWDPHTWSRITRRHASLRAQLSRAVNKQVQVEEISPEQAALNPDLRIVLKEWVNSRRLPPMHFLVEPEILDALFADRVVLVAQRRGRPVAFLVASPIVGKSGYLVELLARSPHAPNGTSELLIDAAMRRFAEENRRYVTLGLVALATAVRREMHERNPFWLQTMMNFARAHANRFYNFRGLEYFRVKMMPNRWEPVYAISNERSFSLRTLYDVGAAFSGISPWLAIAVGIGKALRRELSPGRAND